MGATYPAGVTNIYGETLALTTALASLGMPGIETKQAIVYDPSVDFRLHINPAIKAIYFYEASASAGSRFTDLTRALTDRSATGSGTTLDSRQAGDRLYVCCSDIVGGLRIDMTASTNGENSVLTLNYWDGDSWEDTGETDLTVTSGKSLAKTGSITFSDPGDWVSAHLGGGNVDYVTGGGTPIPGMLITDTDAPGVYGFWLQFTWTLIFDVDTEIANIWTLNKNTDRGYFRAGQEYFLRFDRRATGAIEALTAAGSDTLQITWLRTVI